MTDEISILFITTVSIAFFHTLFGPDHYIPFIVMAKSGKWSKTKTAMITFLCGIGHVLSSVVLGLIGVAAGIAVSKLENIESFRGNIAAWLLIAFGLVYFVWGLKKAYKNKPHSHVHFHKDGTFHSHEHRHNFEHSHVHEKSEAKTMTPWILFTIFVFGPCEPLIPLVMYPAAEHSTFGVIVVTAVFGIVTIGTMMTVVMVSLWGINFLPRELGGKLERFTHALAGATICISGLAIVFLGL
jgi:nickel/cobalt exporter